MSLFINFKVMHCGIELTFYLSFQFLFGSTLRKHKNYQFSVNSAAFSSMKLFRLHYIQFSCTKCYISA